MGQSAAAQLLLHRGRGSGRRQCSMGITMVMLQLDRLGCSRLVMMVDISSWETATM
uniref:Uncharacterized protein n=1 Tax=Arundo donax TaxID=35708 RepID=A0A0A8ZZ24_ARUDO